MKRIFVRKGQSHEESGYSFSQLATAWIGSFIGIAMIAFLSLHYNLELLVPSFGASAVLLYGAPHSPMAQPKNVLGGHLISAFVGVTVYQIFGYAWWSLAIGVSLAIISMMMTDTTHPPGGATAFVSIYMRQDYSFMFTPVLAGLIILMVVALAVNKLSGRLKYPPVKPKESPAKSSEQVR